MVVWNDWNDGPVRTWNCSKQKTHFDQKQKTLEEPFLPAVRLRWKKKTNQLHRVQLFESKLKSSLWTPAGLDAGPKLEFPSSSVSFRVKVLSQTSQRVFIGGEASVCPCSGFWGAPLLQDVQLLAAPCRRPLPLPLAHQARVRLTDATLRDSQDSQADDGRRLLCKLLGLLPVRNEKKRANLSAAVPALRRGLTFADLLFRDFSK